MLGLRTVRVYHQTEPTFMRGWRPGDKMKLAYAYAMRYQGESDLDGRIWRANNIVEGTDDEWPVHFETRSLSVGDVVVVAGKAWSVEHVGWSEVSNEYFNEPWWTGEVERAVD